MKRLLLLAATPLMPVLNASAYIDDVRPLEQVFEESDTILFGPIVAAEIGWCGGKQQRSAIYTLRVLKVAKGKPLTGDVKICAQSDLPLGDFYVMAGTQIGRRHINVTADAVLLAFSGGSFYRINPNESPIVRAENREVYAIGPREPDMKRRFGELLEGAGFWIDSD